MKRFLFFVVITANLLPGFSPTGKAQTAPVTTAATIGNLLPGQQVTVPVTITGFNNIASITLYLDYDYSKIHYVQCNKNPLLSGNFSVGDLDLGTGYHRIVIGWYGNSLTLPDGSWLFNYIFTYFNGNDSLVWFDIGGTCMYSDGNNNILIDTPTVQYYVNGMLCGALDAPGQIWGETAVCAGQENVVYEVATISGATGYSWTVPAGAIITGVSDTNVISVDYSSNSASGDITVSGVNECGPGPVSVLHVTSSSLPTAYVSGGESLCDDGSTAIIITDFTGTPPWNFKISNGFDTTLVSNQYSTPYFIYTSDPGLYTVTSVSDANCSGLSSGYAEVIVNPVPPAPVITLEGISLTSSSPSGNQWLLEQIPIPGATGQSYTPGVTGNYSDIVTLNQCSSDISNYLHVVISTNTTEPMSSLFQIIPNPAKDYFLLKSSVAPIKTIKVAFFTNDGILVKKYDASQGSESSVYLIDIRDLTPGLYFLAIHCENKSVIQKLVVL